MKSTECCSEAETCDNKSCMINKAIPVNAELTESTTFLCFVRNITITCETWSKNDKN